MPDVRLTVGAIAYGGWKSIAITLGIEQIAGGYQLGVSELAPDGSAAADLVPGRRATLSIDGETIITGYIDDVEISHSAQEHAITIRGRDAAGDLVDASAVHKTGQWADQGMLAIARDLVTPFGVSVSAETDLGKPFRTWNVEPGETAFENLDRMARHRGVLLISDGAGGIRITRPGSARAPTALVLGENILTGTATWSYLNRFSEYTVLGQRPWSTESEGEQITGAKGIAKDAAIGRYRPSVEIVEDVADTDTLQRRAVWRRNVNTGRGLRSTITVQGWKHATGLWQPNTRVSVTDRWLRLDARELLIVGVRYVLDTGGTRTELTLTIPSALAPEEIPETEEGTFE